MSRTEGTEPIQIVCILYIYIFLYIYIYTAGYSGQQVETVYLSACRDTFTRHLSIIWWSTPLFFKFSQTLEITNGYADDVTVVLVNRAVNSMLYVDHVHLHIHKRHRGELSCWKYQKETFFMEDVYINDCNGFIPTVLAVSRYIWKRYSRRKDFTR